MSTQLFLFEDDRTAIQKIGNSYVTPRTAKSILNRATGFISSFDYTLNPYVGCQFGCEYCYASAFIPQIEKADRWGEWVEYKENAEVLLRRIRLKPGTKIYVGSVTDPYQPIEAKIELTRRLLEQLSECPSPPSIVIQTRSSLVTRDIDVLRRFEKLRVNISVTTDCETVRKKFEPTCPSIQRRLDTLHKLKQSGIRIGVCITPMLPLRDATSFGERLAALNADVYVTQPFHKTSGRFAARTNQTAIEMASKEDWTIEKYRDAVDKLRVSLPSLCESRNGFLPE